MPNQGLLMLPEPSPGDLFFDIEGDPFFESDEVDGIDYLFGVIEPGRRDESGQPTFHAFWSIEDGTVTTGAERRAFEAFIDLVSARLESDPNLHIYHYAPYEPSAVKRLAGRYGTREEEVDALLRGGVFVDLYRAVRQGIRASVESYSIKQLEPLYGFARSIDLRDANTSIVEFETWLELEREDARDDLLAEIKAYNRDDCVSTMHLRDWLEGQRAELVRELGDPPRPTVPAPEEREDSEEQQAVNALVDALCAGLPESIERHTRDERGRWLLAQLLNWHRREDKAFWWRYFYLVEELTDEERREEPDAIGELTFEESWPDPRPRARSTICRFRFPVQDHAIKEGDSPHDPETGNAAGKVVFIDDAEGLIDLRRGNGQPPSTPTSLIPFDSSRRSRSPRACSASPAGCSSTAATAPVPTGRHGTLLTRRPPRLGQEAGTPLLREGEDAQVAARRLIAAMDHSYLAIQGPPGSGKSTVGAEMIVDLAAAGKRIGVTANSHKVIGELLAKVGKVARERGIGVRIGQLARPRTPAYAEAIRLSNPAARARLLEGSLDVVGGTTWLWAREDMVESVDVLFVDEAGQMSLADALAAALSASNLVLLGDPQQLDQPLQGAHPPGAERSALAHVLDGSGSCRPTSASSSMGPGVSTPRSAPTRPRCSMRAGCTRIPAASASTSGASRPSRAPGSGSCPSNTAGQSSEAPEEAEELAARVGALLGGSPTFRDAEGATHALDDSNVLVITPYNAQVKAIGNALPGFRIGTVDKFQGQEAPISIYSMATSSADEAPRGMEFLYSLNRLNVATSRAQCLAVVVASPALLRVRCRTPREMRLANALARLFEVAGGRSVNSTLPQDDRPTSRRWVARVERSRRITPMTRSDSQLRARAFAGVGALYCRRVDSCDR